MRARPLWPFGGVWGQSDIDRALLHQTDMDINVALLHGVHILLIFTKKLTQRAQKKEKESLLVAAAELRQPPSVCVLFFYARGQVLWGAASNRQPPCTWSVPAAKAEEVEEASAQRRTWSAAN